MPVRLQHACSAGASSHAPGRSVCAHPDEGRLVGRELVDQPLCLPIAQEPGVLLAAEHVPARAAPLSADCAAACAAGTAWRGRPTHFAAPHALSAAAAALDLHCSQPLWLASILATTSATTSICRLHQANAEFCVCLTHRHHSQLTHATKVSSVCKITMIAGCGGLEILVAEARRRIVAVARVVWRLRIRPPAGQWVRARERNQAPHVQAQPGCQRAQVRDRVLACARARGTQSPHACPHVNSKGWEGLYSKFHATKQQHQAQAGLNMPFSVSMQTCEITIHIHRRHVLGRAER